VFGAARLAGIDAAAREGLARRLATDAEYDAFVAEQDDGRIVGFVACGPADPEERRDEAGDEQRELFAIYVTQDNLTDEDRMALERNATLARAQQAHVDVLEGKDPIKTILEYARKEGITQIFVGHNLRRNWRNRLGGAPLDRLIRDAEGIDVRVFPQ